MNRTITSSVRARALRKKSNTCYRIPFDEESFENPMITSGSGDGGSKADGLKPVPHSRKSVTGAIELRPPPRPVRRQGDQAAADQPPGHAQRGDALHGVAIEMADDHRDVDEHGSREADQRRDAVAHDIL